MTDFLTKAQNWLSWFFVSYWKEILIILFVLILLEIAFKIIKKFFKLNISILKIVSFPFKLIWKLLKAPFKAYKNAKSDYRTAEKRNKS